MNRWKQMRLLAAAGVLAAGLLAGPTAYATSQGLKDGSYYMIITIPENFSSNATTLMDKHPKKMELRYTTNPGTNYIASKMD